MNFVKNPETAKRVVIISSSIVCGILGGSMEVVREKIIQKRISDITQDYKYEVNYAAVFSTAMNFGVLGGFGAMAYPPIAAFNAICAPFALSKIIKDYENEMKK